MTDPVLELKNLEIDLFTRDGRLRAVDGLSFSVEAGETLAIIGESGCGKSLTALAIMGLLPDPPARIVGGEVLLGKRDLAGASDREMQQLRGKEISMIFQDPMTSLNPVLTIGRQLMEVIRRHEPISSARARERALDLLQRVRIPDPERRFDDYPHQLSGGMNQRVMIAMAIACKPKLLIADEPTTALDVTIQAQILELMRELQRDFGMALIIITHDLGVVAEVADRVMVMYAGRKVEEAAVDAIFEAPLHPYMRGLLGATPSATPLRGGRLVEIPGVVPALGSLPTGCAFMNRCPDVFDHCRAARPELTVPAEGRQVACFAQQREVHDHVAPVGA